MCIYCVCEYISPFLSWKFCLLATTSKVARFWDKTPPLGSRDGVKDQRSTRLAMDIVRCRYSCSNPGAFRNAGTQNRWSSSIVAGGSEFNPFQMEDGQVLVVGGHDDQGVLDAVELINLTSSEVGACSTFWGNLSTINLSKIWCQVTEMPTTGSHNPLWGIWGQVYPFLWWI